MPKLLFITAPTEVVLNKEGAVRFPGSDAAVQELTAAGWDVTVCSPDWPEPLERAKEIAPVGSRWRALSGGSSVYCAVVFICPPA